MSSTLLPSPSSQHSPLLLRCLDILKVENTLRNATFSNIDYYSSSSFSFTSLLNAFEESFSSDRDFSKKHRSLSEEFVTTDRMSLSISNIEEEGDEDEDDDDKNL